MSYYRSLWISDTHLGGNNLQSEKLYQFLESTDSDYLYLVGDIFDLWKLKKRWYWPKINDRIVQLVMEKANNGTTVVYLPGNHDAMLRDYVGTVINGISVQDEAIHTLASGGRYLVLHGDQFDCVVQNKVWLATIGGVIYDFLLNVNRHYNKVRAWQNRPYFSISAYLKHRCKKAVNYMSRFEHVLAKEVAEKQVDGIICGHIHHASIQMMGDFLYGNAGDWVESCTALAENSNGALGIIEWVETAVHNGKTSQLVEYDKDRYRDRCLAPTN